jgi:amino-acid N-acetyltransferase
MSDVSPDAVVNPTGLRGILKYIPLFQDQVFVIAVDGRIVADDNFGNLLLDIAVLRSLSIKVVLVHGIGYQLSELSTERGVPISDRHGLGTTNEATLNLSVEASNRTAHDIMGNLARLNLKASLVNAVRATPVGIVKGQDHLFSGKVERIDSGLIHHLIAGKVIPLVSPIGFDRDGRSHRLNSDHLATELAITLKAAKLIFLSPLPGLSIEETLHRQIAMEDLREIVEHGPERIEENTRSKAIHAIKAIESGTPRVHILNGQLPEGLLQEIFSNEGVGTLIYGNDYQQVRRATNLDVRAIHNLTRNAVKREELVHRSLQSIEANIDDFFVFEVDENPVACAALTEHPEEGWAELASLYVMPFYQHTGIGKRMVEFACREAKRKGIPRIIALSTQSYRFFTSVCGFREGDRETLHPSRRESYDTAKRNSKVLYRDL